MPNQNTTNTQKHRLTAQRLGEIELQLSDLDTCMLAGLDRHHYLSGTQLRRLFVEKSSVPAAIDTANRHLRRLYGLGLIDHCPRRIGGTSRGSDSLIWFLTEAGHRLLDLRSGGELVRKRSSDPHNTFIRHELATSECFVQIKEICAAPDLRLLMLSPEPESWREYEQNGKTIQLKPDLYAVTQNLDGVYSWFIEVDLDTETLPIILAKCKRYHEYYATNKEQEAHNVFPLTVWIVPSETRRRSIEELLRRSFRNRPQLFIVILPNELPALIEKGIRKERLC